MQLERALPLTYIPFCKYNDSTRLQMACSHIRQAIPLVNPQIPHVKSSMKTVELGYPFIIRAPYKCKCLAILDDKIIIMRLEDKYVDCIDLVTFMFENIYQSYMIAASPGHEYEKGDELAIATTVTSDGFAMTGTNLLCGIDIYYGYNFNDAIVISDRAAKKLTSTHYQQFQYKLYNDQILLPLSDKPELYDMYKYIPFANDIIYKQEPIISISTNFIDKPKHKTYHRDIKVLQSNIHPTAKAKNTLKHYPDMNRFITTYRRYRYQNIYNAIDKEGTTNFSIQVQRLLKELSLPKVSADEANFIVNVLGYYEDSARTGDKLCNRHGNKGCIAKIVPYKEMPYIPEYDDHLDIILNPLGIISRMNIGQLYELHLGKIMLHIDKHRKELSSSTIESIETITGTKIKHLIDNDKSLVDNVSFDDKVSWDDIKQMLSILDTTTKSEVVFGDGDKRITSVGYMYVQKLYHRAANKVSARAIGKYSRRTLQPIHSSMSRAGQRIGEMETWAIAAYDTDDLLKTMMSALSDNRKEKVDLLSKLVGLDIPLEYQDKCEASNLLSAYFKVLGIDLDIKKKGEVDV